MTSIVVIGPGKSSLDCKVIKEGEKVLAFQEVFPNCVDHLGIMPDFWFGSDPNSYVKGLRYLLEMQDFSKGSPEILIPDIFIGPVSEYRKYFGTTPLLRQPGGWDTLQDLIIRVRENFKVTVVPILSTKYLASHKSSHKDLQGLFEEEHLRFMSEKVIIGTVKFDSESVYGSRYKWGLENKLTSSVLPLCYYLRASKVKIFGFDYRGPRFYSEDARHPWNDETQTKNDIVEFSLNLLKKWVEWEYIHGMRILTGTRDKVSLPNRILDFEES